MHKGSEEEWIEALARLWLKEIITEMKQGNYAGGVANGQR